MAVQARPLAAAASYCSAALALSFAAAGYAQGPVKKLLDQIPSLVGTPRQPHVDLPATPVITGVTRAAAATARGDLLTYDIGGFRLGMSEREIEATAGSRRLRTTRVMRVVSFETQVRSIINMRGGSAGRAEGSGVLGEATLKDDAGGTYQLRTLVWPDGAHLMSIAYSAAPGTSAQQWRQMMIEKWGPPTSLSGGEEFSARWANGGSGAHADVQLGLRGGQAYIEVPEGTRSRPQALIDHSVDAFFAANARKPSL
jgi:hypothetical protein